MRVNRFAGSGSKGSRFEDLDLDLDLEPVNAEPGTG